MNDIIWHEIKRNFNWWRVLGLAIVSLLSWGYLFVVFVLYPEKLIDFHLGMYKITALGGLNIAIVVTCLVTTFGLAIFISEFISIYRYYKRQIDEMNAEEKTPAA